MKTFLMRPATRREAGIVIGLIEGAAKWLRSKDTDQWQQPWPTPEARDERIIRDIEAKKTWIAWDGDVAAGTITVEYGKNPNLPELWTPEDDGPAMSAHRAAIDRNYAGIGLGATMFNWAAIEASRHQIEWMR